ncbi:MAG: phosphate acyltransferase PlsX [Myxococcota bacterium]
MAGRSSRSTTADPGPRVIGQGSLGSERGPVAVDAMGGDHAPGAIVAGAVAAAGDGVPVVLVGDEAAIRAAMPRRKPGSAEVRIVHAPDAVGMGDGAVAAVRRSEASSLRVALAQVRDGAACAAVSCGNTGAVLVAAVVDLGVLPGVERPAIASILPRADGGRLVLLDAGANVDCKPEQLVCFAQLGAAYAEVIGIALPRVGLLANGEEDGKGNAQVRAALPLLRATGLQVVGNVEPTAAMDGSCDVLVTDGFVGNVLLKAAEGAVTTVVGLLREEIRRSPSGLAGAWLLQGAFRRFRERVAWDAHGGAVLLGTRGTVVVGHGRANAEAVRQAVRMAARTGGAKLVGAIERRLAAG